MVVSNSKRRRHRRAIRASEQQKLVTGAPRPPVKPGTAPAVTTVERGGKRTPKPKRSTAAPVPSCSGCGKGLKSSKTNQATKGQKRDRPEETVTPTGESKRVKPNKPQKEQADNIRLQIEGKIQDELLADLDATLTTEPNDIRFRGKAHFSDGVLKTWCEDTYTLGWLTGTCDVITNPVPDTRLVVRPQSAIPNRIPCLLHVPDYSGNTETLRKLITRQNRHLNIRSWTLTHERRTQDPTGVSLFFRVPEFEISKIKEHNRRLYYLMGNIYIRILDRDEPSQVANAPPTAASTSGVASSGPGLPTSLTGVASVTGAHVPMEVATQPPSPVQLTSDDELFQETGGVNSATAVCAPPHRRTDLIQANLQHSQTASASLRRLLETNPKTIAAIQEPWIRNGKICGLGCTGGKLLLDTSVSNPRTCIILPKHVPAFLINELCSRNLTAIRLPRDNQPDVVLASAYLPGDEDVPTPELGLLADYCEREKLELIIAADSNAHHTLWGNASTNTRDHIQDWHVSNELSCSDHRWIRFAIKGELPKPQPRRIPRRTDLVKFYKLISSEVDKLSIPTTINIQDIDKHVNNLTSLLLTSYERSCPLTIPRWGGRHNWWCPELERHRRKVRKLFNRAMNTRLPTDWDKYTVARRRFKKLLRTRKQECWRHFCTKTCELLLATHFPGCIIANEQAWQPYSERATDSSDWQVAHKIITNEKVTWAINSFLPFKAAGLDGIFPGLLRWSGNLIVDYLVSVFRACIAHRYIPLKWREVKIIFIPKPGKEDYTQAKSFRPISLTSFFLKTMERLGDLEIRSRVSLSKFLHPNQHAYSSGKSTDSSLHNVVSRIGNSLKLKQSTHGAFIDIEGAFDKTNFTSITRALRLCGVPSTLIEWINNMLKQRAIQFTVNSTTRGIVSRGCPQGGVLSPLLWNLVVNELITELNADNLYTVGYADDIAILISGNFESTLCDLMRRAFKVIERWCNKHELSVNPSKTELILFTNRRVLGPYKLPKLFNTKLILKYEIKYLGVILDSKLLWNKHLEHKLNKATIAFYQCKKMLGVKWGLSPKITLWIYTAIIRPMLAYGALVWWPRTELQTAITKLGRFQRLALSAASGCMKTTPTAAMEMALQILPLDLHIQQEAALAAIRLMVLDLWGKNHYSAHTAILNRAIEYQPLIAAPCDRITNQLIFNRKYLIQLREEEHDRSTVNELRIYTDGSKTGSGSGAGIFSLDLNINIHLPLGTQSTIFQCECVALTEAARAVQRLGINDFGIKFVSDSASVLMALGNKKNQQQTNTGVS
ncbi:unnamed protein product [Pieris macdunnoughi]|uniref:Reverse transcriptase domain-containing protein n=1 Tax=Pieris macdunnoughi TaxID=345717 RepID=A0A821QQG8_9NEOP|nr:unnamed protein product [Pieris macdunnoughi]